jgi:hypothetical protein
MGVPCVPISASHDTIFSVSYGDAQIQVVRGREVPTTDSRRMEVTGNLRLVADTKYVPMYWVQFPNCI